MRRAGKLFFGGAVEGLVVLEEVEVVLGEAVGFVADVLQ